MNIKTERLSIQLLERDKEALRKLAECEGEAMTVVIRQLIREAVRELELNRAEQQLQPETINEERNHADHN